MATRRRKSKRSAPIPAGSVVDPVTFHRSVTFSELVNLASRDSSSSMVRSSRDDRLGFRGSSSFEEALDWARNGWAPGRSAVLELVDKFVDRISADVIKEVDSFDVAGDELDVGAFLDGAPECFVASWDADGLRERLPIRIAFNPGVNCGITTEAIVKRGAAIAALVELLEIAGFSVDLVADHFCSNYGSTHRFHVAIELKQAGAGLDGDRLAFALVCPSFLRRLIFGFQEMESDTVRQRMGFYTGGAYGHQEDNPAMLEPGSGVDLYIGNSMEPFESVESSEQWLTEQLINLGAIREPGSGVE